MCNWLVINFDISSEFIKLNQYNSDNKLISRPQCEMYYFSASAKDF